MNEKIMRHGFIEVRSATLSELDATLHEMTHGKTGASLIYLERKDENKTFAIAFPTPPSDDTGVFHIIEHSVLCGSAKYPLKDPFAELLKSSLNTFLNAITYEDRTVYPVSSRCERDFINLTDVYLDAVFAPKLLENPLIFAQEGWHYEYDRESNTLSYNGVVYNEMKGAYSSPDELSALALNRALYSDSIYCLDSGGSPDAIPALTYEKLKATHQKHYHPSNAKIFLDGDIDLDKLLPLIDSHLSRFDRWEPIVLDSISAPKAVAPETVRFEISEKESPEGKARIVFGYSVPDSEDGLAQLTGSIFADLLCSSNASPLKKALLDRGLCKDAVMYSSRSRHQTVAIEVRDTDADKYGEIKETIEKTLDGLIKNGISRDILTSILNRLEFKLRERDFGSLPCGVAFALSAFGGWMYGKSPEDALLYEDKIAALRARLESDYYEKALAEMITENPHNASVIMLPDPDLSEKNAIIQAQQLQEILSSTTEGEISKIEGDLAALREWQQSEESEEALSSLPTLSISDVPSKSSFREINESKVDGVKILYPQVNVNGIVYISLYFDAKDLKDEELFKLSLLSSAILNFGTAARDPLSLQADIKTNLGSFYTATDVSCRGGISTPYFKLGASALCTRLDDLLRITADVLLTTKIDDAREIENLLSQAKSQIEDAFIAAGESVALSRVEAGISESGAIGEYFGGYEAYKIISDILSSPEKLNALTEELNGLLAKIITKNRLTVSVSGDVGDDFIHRLIALFPEGEGKIEKTSTAPCAKGSEFFLTPSKVAYAVMGAQARELRDYVGYFRVARSILSYEYLWNTVRVEGGAYGTGFVPRRDGSISFYSYRDPSPARSLECYRASTAYLRRLAESDFDLTKFIIGAVGEFDILTTPRTASVIATTNYLNGWTAADEQKARDMMLSMTAADLNTVADIIDTALGNARTVTVGGREHLDSLPQKPEAVIEI